MRRQIRSVLPALLLIASLVAVASCNSKSNPTGPGGGTTANVVIHIQSGGSLSGANAYSPNPASARVGQTVQWVNDDGMTHTATATAGGSFNVSVAPGGASSVVMMPASATTISYHCAVAGHNMTGTINVTP
jgi:plastocyanin